MSKTTVILHRASIFHLPPADGCGRIMLRPGTNQVPTDYWDAVKNIGVVKLYVDNGTIESDPTPAAAQAHAHTPSPDEGLSGMNARKAQEWIDRCEDADQLLRWEAQEDRKGVKKAIADRLEELQGDLNDDGTDEDDEEFDDDDEG